MQDNLNDMLKPIFWKKKRKNIIQSDVWWICPESGKNL